VLVAPSPKFHSQEVGLPVEVSVNWIDCPATGEAGEKLKEEVRTDTLATVTVLLPCFCPELIVAIKVTA
jgi:hypothetical protein